MVDCVFCRIFKGEAPVSFVYKDQHVAAIMSLDQPNPYKVLVIPRKHAESIYDLTDEEASLIFQLTVKTARAIRDASGCEGLNLIQSNGRVTGQRVLHFHLHLLPRFSGDHIMIQWNTTSEERSTLDTFASKIRSRLGGLGS